MRSRNIKPNLFKNELLGTEDPICTILFVGLWCLADRDGKLEDRPLRIKAEIFPYREKLDVNRYLTVIQRLGFILRYKVDNIPYILIPAFKKHQHVHNTEKPSEIPNPKPEDINNKELIENNGELTVKPPLNNGYKPSDILNTDILNTDILKSERLNTDRLKNKKFVPPTLEEIKEYIQKNNYHVKAETFYKYFTEGNWIDSKGNKVMNWKLKIITWEGNNNNGQTRGSKQPTACTQSGIEGKYSNIQCEEINTDT